MECIVVGVRTCCRWKIPKEVFDLLRTVKRFDLYGEGINLKIGHGEKGEMIYYVLIIMR